MDFKNKRVVVVGGTGLIGSPLVTLLDNEGARVRIVSLDPASRAHPKSEFIKLDLLNWDNCLRACQDMEYVFNLFGVKGSPKMTAARPATFFETTMLVNLQLLKAARLSGIRQYLYTSSIGAYPPAEVFREEDVWNAPPSPNDEAAGYAKRMSEFHGKTYKQEFGWTDFTTVYPANIYGPRDNFDSENAMVVPSLIKKAFLAYETDTPMTVWGDGSPVRDFLYVEDAARGILLAVKNGPGGYYNIGSGVGVSIRQLTEIIVRNLPKPIEVRWDPDAPRGDNKRIMDINRIRSLGFEPEISLEEGIRKTMKWYIENRERTRDRYDAFDNKTP